MKEYQKVFTSETEYEIKYNYAGGKSKIVNENQDLYKKWLSEGNTPEVIPYVPPTPQPTEQLRSMVVKCTFHKRTANMASGFVFESMAISTKTESRELILGGSRSAKKNPSYVAKAVLQDGTVADLSNKQLKDLEDALDEYGDSVHQAFIIEYEKALIATREELEYYLEHGEFE